MLIRLGRMINVCGQISPPETILTDTLSFLTSVPAPFQYFRADTVATYRNASGVMVQAGTNGARVDHTAAGVPLGILMEPSRQNKTAARNASPTNLTGLTVGGNGSASISIVDDSASLAAAGLGSIGNGKALEIDNTLGGSGTAYVTIDGTVGNTNAHSMSCYIYPIIGMGYMTTSDGSNSKGISGTGAYTLVEKENFIPSTSTRQMRLNCAIGHKARFILWQLEEGGYSTSVVITAGTAATRAHNRILLTTIASLPAWNEAQGAMVAEITPRRDASDAITSDHYMVLAANGTNINDCFGVYAVSPRYEGRSRIAAASTQYALSDIHNGFIKDKTYPCGVSWVNGSTAKVFVGAGVFTDFAMGATATGFTRMYLGGRDSANSIMGHVRSLRVYNKSRTLSQMLAGFISSNDKALAFSGQSNTEGYFHQQTDGTNGGQRAMQPVLDAIWNTGTRNWLINAATNGTSIAQWTSPAGTAIARWKEIIGAYMDNGGQVPAIIWDQGEANLDNTVAEYKSGWLTIFADMRSFLASKGGTGNEPVIIIPAGRRADSDNDFRNYRLAQRELAAETAWIHLAPEKWTRALDADGVHLADAGYAAQGPHVVRKALKVLGETVSGGVDGPSITNVVRVGTAVTVTITHDGGTDFTPATGIEGFAFLDDGAPITITAAVRTNATTITLTLAGLPTGVEELYYGYRSLYGVNPANLVVDNEATYPKPLKSYEAAL